ncbi:MAG: DUF1330 domain-containing protein [SAR202 cluster bacterium]|nr:DUF1330 domain-containing protein [SAR202 cluster bacterium]
MPGYFMGVLHGINDEAAFDAYRAVAGPTIGQYSGKLLFQSAGVESADGDLSPIGIILFEFESGEQARKWYNSPEYQAVVGQRLASTQSDTVFIDV